MINYQQYHDLVLIPVISKMAGFNERAILALSMIAAHESKGGKYLKQFPTGPALGPYGMEGWVHDDVWKESDNIWTDSFNLGFVSNNDYKSHKHPLAERMIYDMRYATFMSRKRLHMDVRPLPSLKKDMANYLVEYWNAGGDATPEKYLRDYIEWCA